MGHLSLDDLYSLLQAAAQQVVVGGRYQHYKGEDKTYAVLQLAILEATNEVAVVYRAEYDERLTFVRALDVWVETVSWQGKTIPRFKLIEKPATPGNNSE